MAIGNVDALPGAYISYGHDVVINRLHFTYLLFGPLKINTHWNVHFAVTYVSLINVPRW